MYIDAGAEGLQVYVLENAFIFNGLAGRKGFFEKKDQKYPKSA